MQISVIGGGYVGLVSAACFADIGHDVSIVEIDEEKVKMINSGISPMHEKGLDHLLLAYAGRTLRATIGYDGIFQSDLSILCVGTPPNPNGSSNLTMIDAASISIGKALQNLDHYHVVAVKSTVLPGTTETLVIPRVLKHSGLDYSKIGFVMNPEFLREGLAVQDFLEPNRIVIGCSDTKAGDLVEAAYNGINAPIIRTGISEAEMIKYASNAFLSMKISFSNEIGNICKRMGIDVYEVMRAVGMDPRISPLFLNAGAGFGGSCFPKDVLALIHLAEGVGENPSLLKSVIEVNDYQPLRMVELLEKKIGDLRGKRITILGLAFKNDTDDIRESRSIAVIAELKKRGSEVSAYDPLANTAMKKIFSDVNYYESPADALKGADACLVMTEWPEFRLLDNEFDLMRSRVIIEGRKILRCKGVEGICW